MAYTTLNGGGLPGFGVDGSGNLVSTGGGGIGSDTQPLTYVRTLEVGDHSTLTRLLFNQGGGWQWAVGANAKLDFGGDAVTPSQDTLIDFGSATGPLRIGDLHVERLLSDQINGISDDVHSATVSTTDATVTTLLTLTPTDQFLTVYKAVIVGVRDTLASGACYGRRFAVIRNSNTVTAVGAVQAIGGDQETVAAWDATLDIDTAPTPDTVRVRVTGAAGTNISWKVYVLEQRFS